MSEGSTPKRRRPRSAIESEDEDGLAVDSASPSPPDSAKRARTSSHNGDRNTQSPEPEASNSNASHKYIHDEDEVSDGDRAGSSEFQEGAIVRVKLTNFVTYENAEFFPGPHLNMVIGPNGTGKSSLVCAICLGLGWGPQHLGRAGQVGEFVKHGLSEAFVEIELQGGPNHRTNHVVRLRIIRDGNSREFWVNGKKTSLKAVQHLTKALSIQIDNLCQFLPQDKVSEFAALSPVELLQQTQRAAAPEHVLEWHESLKRLRSEQKHLEGQQSTDEATLENLEVRQQNLHAEVQRLQERIQVQEKVDMLKKTIPFVEYQIALTRHKTCKMQKKEAQKRFQMLQERIAPTLQSITEKETYRAQIQQVVGERKESVRQAEVEATRLLRAIEDLNAQIEQNEQQVESESLARKQRSVEAQKVQRAIADLKARLNDPPINFNSAEFNERIRAKEHAARDIDRELRDLVGNYEELKHSGQDIRAKKGAAEQELASFDTQQGQQMNKLEGVSKDTAAAWKWIQDNLNDFEEEVYGPPMISCSVKDSKYTDAVESLLRRGDFLCITAQTSSDLKKLSNQFYGEMRLTDITLRTNEESILEEPRDLSSEEMQRYGMEGWAIDFLDGPGPVLGMLCDSARLQKSAVTLRDITEEQYNLIIQEKKLNRWTTGMHSYNVARRSEYGPLAVSTTTKAIKRAEYWTDRPVDTSVRRDLERSINELTTAFNELKGQADLFKQKKADMENRAKEITQEIRELKDDKGKLQTAHGAQKSLPGRIEREEEALATKSNAVAQCRDRIKKLATQHDLAIIRKAKQSFDYKEQITKIRTCHEELLEALIRFIEADSDVEALTERNRDIVEQRDAEEQRVREMELESQRAKNEAQKRVDVVKELMAAPENEPYREQWQHITSDTTVEALEMEIAAEESKLDFIQANNPNAIRDFERRQAEVEAVKEKIAQNNAKLERIGRHITKIRDKWEPELDKLIATISDAFSYNFEQIGCAGEVSVHKDEEFEDWAIQIKVKFRENETLQLLDQHRQSGGERSVSTIFYLMSLQCLARAPFRVVDEINQGMDPRNERMVHERMVEIACKEHTSQYFLITPKLLTGLRYDKRMKVLCIASGEHMPEDYKQLDVNKILSIRRAITSAA